MMELPKTLKLKRQLSRREKTLLTLLGITVVFLVVFRLIINPQYKQLENLTEEKKQYTEKILNMNTILKKEDEIYNEWNNLHRQRGLILGKYFSNMDQPQIIYILNELLNNEDLDILDIKFNRPYEEQIGQSTVKVMEISIPYNSTYDDLLNTIKKISSSQKKIVISDLTIDRDNDGFVIGDINLKVYSLEGMGGIHEEIVDIETILNSDKVSPFEFFDNYIKLNNQDVNDNLEDEGSSVSYSNSLDNKNSNINSSNNSNNKNNNSQIIREENCEIKLLENFESEGFYFTPSHDGIKGGISRSTNSKSGKYSIRLEYNIPVLEDKNRVCLDLKDRNIIMKSPPSTIGIWVYAYHHSPIMLGFQFKGQANEELDMNLSRSINWKGWRYLETVPPQDGTLYPLQLGKIYLELDYNRGDCGVLLFDKLEANYSKGNPGVNEHFDFYVVEKDDTLDKISIKVYGTTSKKNIIMKYNEIKSDKEIKEGRILVIPR